MRNYLSGMAGSLGGRTIDPRRTYAQQLLAQGASTSPKNAGEGLSQLAKSALGMLLMKRSMAQESDMWKKLNAQQPDIMRPPNDEEMMQNPAMADLFKQAETGVPNDGMMVTPPAPLPDNELMRQGNIPEMMKEINLMNTIQESPDLTQLPFKGGFLNITPEDRLKLPGAIDSQSAKFAEAMDQARTASTAARPRDFGAELQSGIESYRGDESNQVMQDKMSQMDWMQQQLRGMEGNPFAMRMMQNLMFQKMAQGQADRVYDRGLADRRQDTALAQDIQADQFATTTELQARRLAQAGFTLSKTTLPNGMEQRVWLNRETGESKLEGEPYDPNIKSEAAQAQDIASRNAGRTTWQAMTGPGGAPSGFQQSSRGKIAPVPLAQQPKAVEAVDKAWAKHYEAVFPEGQIHDAVKNLSQLDKVVARLDAVARGIPTKDTVDAQGNVVKGEVENLTGPVIGMRPPFLDTMFNPAQADVQDTVEEVVQRNLRVVLGAQFTEKEGSRLIARAFNPKLPEAENYKRVKRLVDAMRGTLQNQLNAGKYYEEKGTLRGWGGTSYTMSISDAESIIDGTPLLKTGEGGNVKYGNQGSGEKRGGGRRLSDKKQELAILKAQQEEERRNRR
jgi:hypothetical protein